ncbi:MAG: HD domain-containing phosphohydrolase [Proteocatella sp.]
MKNFLLEGFLNTKNMFDGYIEDNHILKEAVSIGMFVYNSDYSDISYQFGKCCLEDDLKIDIFEINNEQALINRENTEIRKIEFSRYFEYDKSEGYILSVKNSVSDSKIYASSMILKYEELPDIDFFCENFNFKYFEHFQFHIQAVANNYEKLFYIIDVFTDMLSKRDKYMPYHMSNVAIWCNKIANNLEISEREHIVLHVSALVHDIGKMFIPEEIINKPSRLTEDEYNLIKEHPEKSGVILGAILYGMSFFNEVPDIVRHHHEYFNGNGYPDGLEGEDIPYLSRILTLADGIDAMLSRRAYKEPMSVPEIVREISTKSGIQYDPIIAEAAIQAIEDSKAFVDINSMGHVNFISKASLSFFVKDYNTLKAIPGNLMVKNKEAMFIFDHEKYANEDIDVKKIYKPTIGFFGSNDFYEFSCELLKITNKGIEIKNVNYIPTDTYFSMYLLKPVQVISKNNNFDGDLIKFGGDTAVVRFKNSEGIDIKKSIEDMVVLELDEEIRLETGIDKIQCRMIKLFYAANEYTAIFKYLEISSVQRDSILRFLFRKQLEHRKQIKNAK